jgi:hypothetical protein
VTSAAAPARGSMGNRKFKVPYSYSLKKKEKEMERG